MAASSSPAAGTIQDPLSPAVPYPHGQASSVLCSAEWDMGPQRFTQRCKCFTLPLVTVQSKTIFKRLQLEDLGGHRHWSCWKDIPVGVILYIFFLLVFATAGNDEKKSKPKTPPLSV